MLIYKDNGPHARKGGTFDFKGVSKASELKEALADGYFLTMEGVETGSDPESAWKSVDIENLIDDIPAVSDEAPKAPETPKDTGKKPVTEPVKGAPASAKKD